MPKPQHARSIISALVAAILISPVATRAAGPATRPATAAEVKDLRLRVAKLNKSVLGEDVVASRAAVAELPTLGDVGKASLADALRQMMPRERLRAEAAAKTTGDAAQVKAAEVELTALRQEAAGNLAKLDRGETLKAARANYDKLNALYVKLQPMYASRTAVLDVLERRDELKAAWGKCAPAGAKPPFDEAGEAQLVTLAEKTFAMPWAQAWSLLSPEAPEPGDAALRGLWLYRYARRVEAYNRSLASLLDPVEVENVRLVNAYRERLGARPLEVDARLVQAARRHAKEMWEMKYVAQKSPTTGEPAARMLSAGYTTDPSAESVAAANSAETAFAAWFNTPADHQNLVTAQHTAVGAGRWGDKWAMTFGGGSRLMFAAAEDRDKAAVQGETVPPQSQAIAAAKKTQPGGSGSSGGGGTASAAGGNGGGGGQHPEPNPPNTTLPKPRLPGGDGGVPSIPGLPGLPGF